MQRPIPSIRVVALVLAHVPLVACGGAAAPSPTAPAPTTAPAESARCLGTSARHRPAGWVESGKIVVALKDGQPTSFEAHDANGKVVASKAAPSEGEAARAMLSALTCQVGGLVALFEGEPPKHGVTTVTLPVLKPRAADEKLDLATMCKPPEGLPTGPNGPDEFQKVRIAFDVYQESLTTPKWRAWLVDLLDASRKATDDTARLKVRKAKSDELKAAATSVGVASPCWFAEGIARPPPAPPAL